MIDIIENNRHAMQKLCQQYQVSRLEVFGSAAQAGKFDSQQSDLDFLVEFKPLEMGQNADTYFGLRESLEKLFHREVDLVMTCAIKNKYFLESINNKRQLIYAD